MIPFIAHLFHIILHVIISKVHIVKDTVAAFSFAKYFIRGHELFVVATF